MIVDLGNGTQEKGIDGIVAKGFLKKLKDFRILERFLKS